MPVFRSGWPLVAKGYGFYFGSMLMFSGVGDVASFWIGTCPTSQYFGTYEPCCPIGVLTIYLFRYSSCIYKCITKNMYLEKISYNLKRGKYQLANISNLLAISKLIISST